MGGGGITSVRSWLFMPKFDTVSQVLLQLVVAVEEELSGDLSQSEMKKKFE